VMNQLASDPTPGVVTAKVVPPPNGLKEQFGPSGIFSSGREPHDRIRPPKAGGGICKLS
jgi:hypothetical protein